MNKWTKGFLVFGVTASILGTCAMVTGAATGGVDSLLTLSDKPVYQSSSTQDTIRQSVDKLDISLSHHSVSIIDSPDDQIHVTYYKRLTGKTDFTSQVQQGTLTITDQKEQENRDMGRGLGLLLDASSSITGRNSEIQIALPKNKTFKDIRIKHDAYTEHVHLARVKTDSLTIDSQTYHTAIYGSKIGKGDIKAGDIFYAADSQLTNTQIHSVGRATLDTVTIHGRVTVENAYGTDVYLNKAELNRIHTEISSKDGEVYHIPYKKDEAFNYAGLNEKKVANPYSYGDKNSKDQLIVKSQHGELQLLEVQ